MLLLLVVYGVVYGAVKKLDVLVSSETASFDSVEVRKGKEEPFSFIESR